MSAYAYRFLHRQLGAGFEVSTAKRSRNAQCHSREETGYGYVYVYTVLCNTLVSAVECFKRIYTLHFIHILYIYICIYTYIGAVACLIKYSSLLKDTSTATQHVLNMFDLSQYMKLDQAAVRALNLFPKATDCKFFCFISLVDS